MAHLAIRSFTSLGYIGASLLIAIVAVLALTSFSEDGSSQQPIQTATPAPTQVSVGPGGDFASISEGIEAAGPTGIVEVRAGVYRESVRITEAITLRAAGDGAVWIDRGCGEGAGIHVYSGSGVTIRGIGVRKTGGAGVLVGDNGDGPPPDHVTLDGLTIEHFNCNDEEFQASAGIAVWQSACCQTITDNTITYRTSGDPRGHGNGIWFKSTDEDPSGGGHYIAGNTITGGWDGIGGESEWDVRGSFDRSTVIENNTVTDCWDDGIQVEGGNEDVRVTGNIISGCGTGIAFAPTLTGPLYIARNQIRDLKTGLYDNLFCFKTGHDSAGRILLTANVCDSDGDGLMQTNSGQATIVSRDNCFRVSRYVMRLRGAVPEGTSFDGDSLWTSDPERFVAWDGEEFQDIAGLQAGTGQEANGDETPDCPLTLD
ncbi:MAG TPA: right-handed parallel beta-helix repeat-containing protein [Dehalococcoidia bacterium]